MQLRCIPADRREQARCDTTLWSLAVLPTRGTSLSHLAELGRRQEVSGELCHGLLCLALLSVLLTNCGHLIS